MNSTTRLQTFKAQLAKQDGALAKAFDEVEERLSSAGWKIAYFNAPPPQSADDREQYLAALEARFEGGKIPEPIRKSLSDFYGIADGFVLAFGPAGLPDPMDLTADREAWEERGPIGYTVFNIERTLQWVEPYLAEDGSDPSYAEGGITQLFSSDFAKGVKPNTSAFRYSSYVSLGDDDDETLDPTSCANESYETHKIVLQSDAFPGGYLDEDGDQQPFLMLDDEEAPSRISFTELLAKELVGSVGAIIANADD